MTIFQLTSQMHLPDRQIPCPLQFFGHKKFPIAVFIQPSVQNMLGLGLGGTTGNQCPNQPALAWEQD